VSRWPRNEARKAAVLAEIVRYLGEHGVPPTLEELADELRVSLPVAHKYVERLEAEGRLSSLWVAGRRSPRSLRVVPSRQLVLVE